MVASPDRGFCLDQRRKARKEVALEIKAQRWLAIWYRCPKCGSQTFQTFLKPTKRNRERTFECQNWSCRTPYEIVERRYWTSFCIEPAISGDTIAGTLAEFGGWRVCHIVHRNIREFKRWYRMRKAELAEQHRLYMEEWRRREAEGEARRKREAEVRALLREAEKIAYRREHAVELLAEQVARAVWPNDSVDDYLSNDDLGDLYDDDHPF